MNQLADTHLDEQASLVSLSEPTDDGYRLFAVVVDNEIVSLASAAVEVNMYYGRYVRVYELVTDSDHRSAGYGWNFLRTSNSGRLSGIATSSLPPQYFTFRVPGVAI